MACLAAIGSCLLPTNEYRRFQLLDGTIFGNLRWIYERTHYDARPIDVAVVGPSRSYLGISAGRVEEDLLREGKPATVANLSVVQGGRNVQWVVVDQLLRTKKPKVLVLEIDETPSPWGHPAFKYVAPARAVAVPPAPFLHNYLYDVVYLPFRQLELFGASMAPGAFGLSSQFDPARYAAVRTDFTTSFRDDAGKWIDRDGVSSRESLLEDYRAYEAARKKTLVPRSIANVVEADDETYTREIAKRAADQGVKILFLYIPRFDGSLSPSSKRFYGQYGMLQDNSDLAQNDQLYGEWAHFNHAGAMILSDRLAQELGRLL